MQNNINTVVSEIKTGMLRPYEKFEMYGVEALSDTELLAVIIKTGCRGKTSVELSREILYGDTEENGCGLLRLMRQNEDSLKDIKGIGRVKFIQICCLCELSKRISREHAENELDISNPQSVADYYMETLRHKSEEEVHLMLLNSRNKLKKSIMISKGTATFSAVSPREIFISALRYKASGIILVHNHPGGDPTPSPEDITLAEEIYKLSNMMCVPLRDFVIIGDKRYVSFIEEKLFLK